MNTLIRQGRIIDPSRGFDAVGDLLIIDGRIAGVEKGSLGDATTSTSSTDLITIDAAGCVVCPGFVDLHCHLREPGYEDKETIATGANAAVRGGFTTICCMPNTMPAIDTRATVEYVLRTARSAGKARVMPIAAITKQRAGNELTEMAELVDAGVVGFSDDGKAVANSRVIRHALDYSRMFGRPIIEHCEDAGISEGGLMNEGLVATRLGMPGIPSAAEEIVVARDIALAELTGGWLHVAHISTARSVEMVRQAKAHGLRVTAEVTPHHLVFTEDWVAGYRGQWPRSLPYDTNTKVNPPLRNERDRQALIQGLKDGTIDAIATDHAPHTVVDKLCEYELAPSGISSLETALATLMTLVQNDELPLELLVSKLTFEPARAFNLPWGSLAVGAPADVVVFAPGEEWTVDKRSFASKGWNTPLDGLRVKGRVKCTFVGGCLVYDGRNDEGEGSPGA